jgi:arsenate reductase
VRPPEEPKKKRVLFVCIGNSCRSQMAEGFARVYGSDTVIAASAGMAPAFAVAPDSQRAMMEKNVDLRDHFPKHIRHLGRSQFDLVVNMSGYPIPDIPGADVVEWDVPDPVAMTYEEHCGVRDQIEGLVMKLLLELRRQQKLTRFRGQGSGRLPL